MSFTLDKLIAATIAVATFVVVTTTLATAHVGHAERASMARQL